MKQRIIGFDLARAYAILGMFIVNFNTVFGSLNDKSFTGKFLSLFSGNSSSTFVILAGMGISLMTNRKEYNLEERQTIKNIISNDCSGTGSINNKMLNKIEIKTLIETIKNITG